MGRPHDWGYPIRGIIKDDYLFLINFKPQRWPAGNPETGYLNCDGSPTKTEILNMRRSGQEEKYWQFSFGKRPSEELYHIASDRECIRNLVDNSDYTSRKNELRKQLLTELKNEGDPRILGNGDILEKYPSANKKTVNFYERYMSGEHPEAKWVNPSDFEK